MSKGLAMGTADIIPGVSGGTIALISGIYDHLISAIDSVKIRHARAALLLLCFFWNAEKRNRAWQDLLTIEWNFILPLLTGILAALFIMVQVIPWMLENHAFYAFSFFFGLIIFSITVPYKRMQHRIQELVLLIVFAIVTFFLTGISRVSDAILLFQPDAVAYMSDNESGGELEALANQKGGWSLTVPLDHLVDAGDPRCSAFKCLLLPGETDFNLNSGQFENKALDRARLFTVQIQDAKGQSIGVLRLLLAAEDISAEQYLARQNQADAAESAPRVYLLDNQLNGILFEIKKAERRIHDGVDVIEISGSIGSEASHDLWVLYISGALAICAMVLPGISGAYILVLTGQYQYIASVARDLIHNLKEAALDSNPAAWAQLGEQSLALLVFAAGVATGLFSFVKLLKYLLKNFHSQTMAALTGLMIGSLRYIWPPSHFSGTMEIGDWLLFGSIAVLGASMVYFLEYFANKMGDPDAPDPEIH
ncbi:MAG: DUF368 domain-containing protein [Leptospiraceae bacterium]|nr:DUF368 domain-containing protein [Leptospiraceae bacterium]